MGSGAWYRWDKKLTLNETRRVDIRFMRKQGMLKAGYSGTLSWTCRNESNGGINFTCDEDFLILSFQSCRNGGEWEPVKQKIFFDTTPCNYGGTRKWFLCPGCNRRVGILSGQWKLFCGQWKLFLCRHCCDLSYISQSQCKLDRQISQKHKLGRRIFEDYENGNGWQKKKWMHQKTFELLKDRYYELDSLIDYEMYQRFCI